MRAALDVETTPIADLLVLTPRRFGDHRGWFSEVWNAKSMEAAGVSTAFVQDNHSYSAAKGTVRGLHYQAQPHAQAKLVRCGAGAIWDVAVDARKESATFGQWFGVELSAENGRQLLVPAGFLHGFSTVTENAEVLYKCSDFYAADADGSVKWDSPTLNIDWKVDGGAQLSQKDLDAPDFSEWDSPF